MTTNEIQIAQKVVAETPMTSQDAIEICDELSKAISQMSGASAVSQSVYAKQAFDDIKELLLEIYRDISAWSEKDVDSA
jgi:hypothetical protein